MKNKKIHDFIKNNCFNLQSKVSAEEQRKTLPQTSKEYTKGQLYESNYILENVERIIYED